VVAMSHCLRYWREIDLADASLYWLAIKTSITDIMTVDVADFSRYRLPDGKAFMLLGSRGAGHRRRESAPIR